MAAAATEPAGTRTLQGIEVPADSINPGAFFAGTRRKMTPEYNKPFAGLGLSDAVELRKSDIVAGLHVKFSGSLVVTTGGGTVGSTLRWPYDLVKAFRFTANGQSNLINCSGLKLKVREQMANADVTDRGVSRTVGATPVQQGTLSLSSENWGVPANGSNIASGTYPVELYWYIPIAEDHKDLAGAIFAQTSAMDLTLNVDYETSANLFPTTAGGTAVLNGNISVTTEKYSIPVVGGNYVLPDLSMFHSVIQTRVNSGIGIGDNEFRVLGQGAGKQLLRTWYQVWSGATPAPLAAIAANYGQQGWRYGSNETPELWLDAQILREWNERIYNTDIGAVWGFLSHEFATINGFRDVVDMGTAGEFRLLVNIANGVVLTNPAIEYVQETMFAAGQGN